MKLIKRYGGGSGGGGNTTQQVQTIPDWMRPYLEKGLASSASALDSGALSNVAGFTEEQKLAQGLAKNAALRQQGVAQGSVENLDVLGRIAQGQEVVPATTGATEAIKAAAARDAQKGLQGTVARQAKSGAVGGGRQVLQANEAQNDLAAKLASIDYQDLQARRQGAQSAAGTALQGASAVQSQLGTGADTLKGVGSEIQKQNQAELDKEFQGLSRFSSLVQGTPWQSQQNVQQQGGK